ncbi:GntR family transcriptional regulator [Acerihabitans sp. TG2]|uniref:GntR family transcriptional regulator n=1 Tax=Acerihabitans sp. TG2 TaxID=3096008 RepID=UPI002B2398E6|nr:GntR family transcriptional regulator [Acerihabitans sp. TG2]MEA9391868.1 GntR family transcriptional regulator [Acerihabitans sp. TG2]
MVLPSEKAVGKRPRKAYLAARRALLSLLETPEYNPGDQIPAERELSYMLGISRMTLRKIIDELITSGMLQRNGNRGTFLAGTAIERPLSQPVQQGISKIVELNGAVPSSKLIFFHQDAASSRIARLLDINTGMPVLIIKRLRLANTQPFCLETSYLPQARVPGLCAEDMRQGTSLNQLLAERYGIIGTSDEGTIRAGIMSEEEQQLLQAGPGAPALTYRGVIFDALKQPNEYLVSVNHAQRVAFKITTNNPANPEIPSEDIDQDGAQSTPR